MSDNNQLIEILFDKCDVNHRNVKINLKRKCN